MRCCCCCYTHSTIHFVSILTSFWLHSFMHRSIRLNQANKTVWLRREDDARDGWYRCRASSAVKTFPNICTENISKNDIISHINYVKNAQIHAIRKKIANLVHSDYRLNGWGKEEKNVFKFKFFFCFSVFYAFAMNLQDFSLSTFTFSFYDKKSGGGKGNEIYRV